MFDRVVGFRQVGVESENVFSEADLLANEVLDGLEREDGTRVWAKCILRGREDVVVEEEIHKLVVEEGVKDFCDNRE
jgi:hypothetical protein